MDASLFLSLYGHSTEQILHVHIMYTVTVATPKISTCGETVVFTERLAQQNMVQVHMYSTSIINIISMRFLIK